MREFVDLVLGQQAAVVVADVRVSSGSIGAVVDDFALRWDCSVGLHW